MTAGRLIQIVPVRARTPEGVGDHARIIAEQMRADAGIETRFIACTPLPAGEERQDEWETVQLGERSADALIAVLESFAARDGGAAPILLHLSGYGYDRRGAPFWLARALRRWRRAHPRVKIAIVFHELFAIGPVTSKMFWLGRVQAMAVRAIQRTSDGGITTVGRTLPWLNRAGLAPVQLYPCFATIGESEGEPPAASTRRPVLAVFGRGPSAREIYGEYAGLLAEFVRANGIEEILDIGPRDADPPSEIAGAKLTRLGSLPPEELRSKLLEARFGIVRYDADWLPKSSILAAYAAHGTIPVCLSEQEGKSDGLDPGSNYLRLEFDRPVPALDTTAIDHLQAAAIAWYRPHSIRSTVACIRGLIAGE